MKKITNYCIALLLVANATQAQTADNKTPERPFYLRLGLGYAFPHAGNTSGGGVPSGSVNSSGNLSSQSAEKTSFGAGGFATLAGGYMLTEHLGVELGITANLLPPTVEYTEKQTNSGGTNSNSKTSTKAKLPLYLIPAIVIQTGGDLNVYARVGLTVNVAGKLVTDVDVTQSISGSQSSTSKITTETTFRTGIGFQGAVGVSYPVMPKLRLFAETNGIAVNQYLKEQEITKYVVNGMDLTSKLTTNAKKTVYESSISSVSNSNPSPNEPTKELMYALPFSNVGIQVGARLSL